jgi:hypothetical protein
MGNSAAYFPTGGKVQRNFGTNVSRSSQFFVWHGTLECLVLAYYFGEGAGVEWRSAARHRLQGYGK